MESKTGITIIGLGPGNIKQLSLEAHEMIASLDTLYVRTKQHPLIKDLPRKLKVRSFDHFYEEEIEFESVYSKIVDEIIGMAEEGEEVHYAVPGHPFIAESTAPEIFRLAKEKGIAVRVISGMSFIEPATAALGLDLFPQSSLVDALDIAREYHPKFPPSFPALITQIYSKEIANQVKLSLMAQYEDEHQVTLLHGLGTAQEVVEEIPLHEIDKSEHIGLLTCLYLPPIEANSSLEEFQELIAHLRSPEGCPWDREQDHQSLRRNLLEESYEVLDAIDRNDPKAMQEEFGDLLVQVVLHAQIATEAGEFRLSDVINGIHTKLVHRHPHVFEDLELEDADDVIVNWEQLKTNERAKNGDQERGALDSVAASMPALAQAEAYGMRASRFGFDWPEIDGVLDKVMEELEEIEKSGSQNEEKAEFGDLLFALVNFARWKKIDPEVSLREANKRFKERFSYVEKEAKKTGSKLKDMTLEELEALWQEGKAKGKK